MYCLLVKLVQYSVTSYAKMKCLIFAVFLLCIFLPSTYSRHVQFYRKDYTYIEEFDAFYKVHWDTSGSAWSTAFLTCDDEGSILFYPEAQREWTLVKNLTDQMTEVPNVTDIFVGLHDEFRVGQFITVDGHSTPYPLPADGSIVPRSDHCITMNIDTGKFKLERCSVSNTPLPFVCKKVDDDVSCPTVDHGYRFLKKSKKCYKINKKPQNWQEAMKTCFMEGGILAVIENGDQAQEINNILKLGETYFVGVKKLFSGADYYTIKGQKFSDMYQNPYNNGPNLYGNIRVSPYNYVPNEDCSSPDENGDLPDENGRYPDGHYCRENVLELLSTDCGTVCNRNNNNLYTETRNCNERLPFICEMEIGV